MNNGDWMENEHFDLNDIILWVVVILAIVGTVWSFCYIDHCNKVVDAMRVTTNSMAEGQR